MEHVAADVRRLKLKGLKARQTIAWGQAKQTPSWAIIQKISSPALFFLLLLQLPFGESAVDFTSPERATQRTPSKPKANRHGSDNPFTSATGLSRQSCCLMEAGACGRADLVQGHSHDLLRASVFRTRCPHRVSR